MPDEKLRSVPRREVGTVNVGFQVYFVERRYDACRRWYNKEYRPKYVSGVAEDRYRLLDREETVKDQIDRVHSSEPYYGCHSTYLLTCVEPDCPMRGWEEIEFDTGSRIVVKNEEYFGRETMDYLQRKQIRKEVHDQLRAMAEGPWGDLQFPCPTCRKKRPVFAIQAIEKKWIYVLKETGKTLQPVQEIYAETGTTGRIHVVLENGQFTTQHSKEYEGHLDVPDLTKQTWHFFLSPVKLGPKSLGALCQLSKLQAFYDSEREDSHSDDWGVPVKSELQPWAATVPRRFSDDQLKVPFGEYIPLVDPFAWAGTAVEVDYMPILEAQRTLALDRNEQAKVFIASAIAKATSKGADAASTEGGAASGSRDPWKLEEELRPPPPAYSSSDNVATAWMERYRALAKYLAKESDQACCRVFYPALFSPGHRIVEMSCQEHLEATQFLAFGMSHWLHLLSQASACRAGRIFLRSVALSDSLAERIPQKNVIRGESLGSQSAFIKEETAALPAQLFGFLAPALISDSSSNAAADLARHLKVIGLSAWALEDKQVDFVEQGLDWALARTSHYIESLDRHMLIAELNDSDLPPLKERMMIFGWNRVKGFKIMATFLGVILRFNKWKEHRKFLPSNLEELESAKSGWEIAAKVPQFALELWKGQLESQIEYLSFQRAGRVLSEEELSVIETTAARAEGAEVGIRFLTGPIGFILGALDVVLETHNSIESAEAGDSGAMWGHAVIAAGALLGLAPSVALLSGAEAVAWAGPVGLVAAIIMAGGAIIVAKCSKNDLQMFAMHCFLGNEYGHGQFKETEKPWMAETSWPGLRYVPGSKKESDDRFLLQRTALLRLLCNYSTRVVSDHHSGSCYIYPRLIPDGGIFEVSVEFRQFLSPKTCPVEVYKASILPGQEKFQWTGTIPPYGSGITFTRETNGRDIKWVNVKIVAKAQTEVDTVFRTRLLLDPAGEFTVPAKDWVADHS